MKTLKRTNPSDRPIKILQFGGGNFLRGYFDWMVDVLNDQTDFNGDVIIVKPTEQGDYHSLRDQDGLYHVRTNGIRNGNLISDVDLIECIQGIIHPYQDWSAYLNSAHESSIRYIVSNTTESGIQYNDSDKFLDISPKEFPAKLTRWLYERWTHFKGASDKGCVILPFELIENNGLKLKECVLNYANLWELEESFSAWLNDHNSFCNTLVDRIVTGFPKSDIEEIFESIGFKDELIVDAEPYHLLVIQGPESLSSELPFGKTNLNVKFTNDLSHYREIKVRILNGAHTSMVPIGYLSGLETVGEVMNDPELSKFISRLLVDDVIPTLDFHEDELMKYLEDVLDRFRNPFIHHKLIDISLNSISKFKTRLLPSVLEYHSLKGYYPQHILTAFTALLVFYQGKRNSEDIALRDNDEIIDFFKSEWKIDDTWTYDNFIKQVLSNKKLWDQDLSLLNNFKQDLVKCFATHQANNSKFILNGFSKNHGGNNWSFSLN